jgi:hypothetical protein
MSEQTKTPKKATKDKKHGFNVPLKSGPKSTRFCYYIYTMIKEANPLLLEKDDIKTAYNNFVECCKKYDENLITWAPEGQYKYQSGIKPLEVQHSKYPDPFKRLPMRGKNEMGRTMYLETTGKTQPYEDDIMNHYMALYELIKRDVVPYMETKDWERRHKKEVEFLNSKIQKLEEEVKKYTEKLESIQKIIYKYACEALELQSPKLTQFD